MPCDVLSFYMSHIRAKSKKKMSMDIFTFGSNMRHVIVLKTYRWEKLSVLLLITKMISNWNYNPLMHPIKVYCISLLSKMEFIHFVWGLIELPFRMIESSTKWCQMVWYIFKSKTIFFQCFFLQTNNQLPNSIYRHCTGYNYTKWYTNN